LAEDNLSPPISLDSARNSRRLQKAPGVERILACRCLRSSHFFAMLVWLSRRVRSVQFETAAIWWA